MDVCRQAMFTRNIANPLLACRLWIQPVWLRHVTVLFICGILSSVLPLDNWTPPLSIVFFCV